jgi:hypothetical protein
MASRCREEREEREQARTGRFPDYSCAAGKTREFGDLIAGSWHTEPHRPQEWAMQQTFVDPKISA